jgi:hypothetical protein
MTRSANRDSAVSIVTRLWSRHPTNSDSITGNNKQFTSPPKRSNVLLGSIQRPNKWVLEAPWEQCDLEVNNLVLRLRTELYLQSPHVRYGVPTDNSAAN